MTLSTGPFLLSCERLFIFSDVRAVCVCVCYMCKRDACAYIYVWDVYATPSLDREFINASRLVFSKSDEKWGWRSTAAAYYASMVRT